MEFPQQLDYYSREQTIIVSDSESPNNTHTVHSGQNSAVHNTTTTSTNYHHQNKSARQTEETESNGRNNNHQMICSIDDDDDDRPWTAPTTLQPLNFGPTAKAGNGEFTIHAASSLSTAKNATIISIAAMSCHEDEKMINDTNDNDDVHPFALSEAIHGDDTIMHQQQQQQQQQQQHERPHHEQQMRLSHSHLLSTISDDNVSTMGPFSSPIRQHQPPLNDCYEVDQDHHAPSPLPFAISTNSLRNLDCRDNNSSPCDDNVIRSTASEEALESSIMPPLLFMTMATGSSHSPQHTHQALCEGKKNALHCSEDHNADPENDSDIIATGGGIVILDPSTEEEISETLDAALRGGSKGYDSESGGDCYPHSNHNNIINNNNSLSMSPSGGNGIQITSAAGTNFAMHSSPREIPSDPASTSVFENDSIILAAAAHVNANTILDRRKEILTRIGGGEVDEDERSLNFEQLMQEAEFGGGGGDQEEVGDLHIPNDNIANNEGKRDENVTASSSNMARTTAIQPTATATSAYSRPPPIHTPIRATRLLHDKFIVEVDIFSPHHRGGNSQLDVRDVMDIMANIDLLHLWFDPIPAVFDATVKDGSGNNKTSLTSPQISPTSSFSSGGDVVVNATDDRRYDGEWIEVSTPLLMIPRDAKVSGFLRSIRMGVRSLIGFPARMRSMIFVERQRGRIGMTLGPYPDGWFNGTMAYHSFTVRVVDDEENGAAQNRQRIVVTDEVRLQRGQDDEFHESRRRFGYCAIVRLLFGFLEWLLFRWHQPDLGSYISQSMSSLEKFRDLVERGETMAFAGAELVMEGNDWEEGNSNDVITSPLLG